MTMLQEQAVQMIQDMSDDNVGFTILVHRFCEVLVIVRDRCTV